MIGGVQNSREIMTGKVIIFGESLLTATPELNEIFQGHIITFEKLTGL